jgi:hypothetical protein
MNYKPNAFQQRIHDAGDGIKRIVSNVATGTTVGCIQDMLITGQQNPGYLLAFHCDYDHYRSVLYHSLRSWLKSHIPLANHPFEFQGSLLAYCSNLNNLKSAKLAALYLNEPSPDTYSEAVRLFQGKMLPRVERPVVLVEQNDPYAQIIACNPFVNEANLPPGYYDGLKERGFYTGGDE